MSKASKILYSIVLVFILVSFVLPELIRFRYVVFIFALAYIVAILQMKLKYTFSISAAVLVALLEFLHVLPLPYGYLTSHGMFMSGAILITLVAASAYVGFGGYLVYLISRARK